MLCEQFEHIHEIRRTYHGDSELSKANQMNLIEILAEDLNKTNAHFIFELIQNAEDNTYVEPLPYISFWLTKTDPTSTEGSDGALVIENNEIGFNRDNVNAICAGGQSPKKKAQKHIGEKGIGFKSVFRVTGNPHIFSNGYHFCLPESDEETGLGYIVPRWINIPPEGLNPSATYIILPLTKSDFGYTKIEEMLEDIQPEVILFLSTLKQIRVKTDTGIDFTISKDNERQPEVAIDVKGNKVGNYNGGDFLVCPKTFDKPSNIAHEKRKGVEDREVSIAFPLDENSTASEKVFAYLPVRDDTGLPFLINADFILTSSRDDIHEDVPWNRWLMECVADLIVEEFLPLLKERERLNVSFLETLASKLNNLAEHKDNLFYPIFSQVRETLMNEEFLPANDRTYVSASNAKLARGNPIRNLLNHKQLSDLFCSINTTNETKWLSDEITQDLAPELRTYLTLKLDVDEVDPSMFARRLTLLFLSKQCDEWFIKFYRFLSGQSTLWRSQGSVLRDKPILRLQDGAHVNPFKEDKSPNAYLPIGQNTDTSFPIVKIELTQDNEAHRFLTRDLGIPKWDIVDEVISHILPKYGHDSPTVPLDDHKGDFAKINSAYETNLRDKQDRLLRALGSTPFILIESSDIGNVNYRRPNQLYFPSDELRLYFKGSGTCAFVNLDEYPPSAHELFKKLGVEDSVRVDREKEKDARGRVIIYRRYGSHKRGLNGFDPNIEVDGLEYALNNPTPEKSAFIWNEIARSNVDCIRGTIEKSRYRDYVDSDTIEEISDKFGRLLIDKKWLPDTDGNMHKPSELTLKELPEGFIHDEQLADQLRMKKDVVAELAEESGVPVEIIEEFRQNPEKYEEFKKWKTEKEALEKKEQKVPEQSIQEKNVPYDKIPVDVGSTPSGSSPSVGEGNNSSTTKEGKGPETGNAHTDSENNGSAHTSPQPSVSHPSPQGSSHGDTSRRSSSGGNSGGGPGKTHKNLQDDLADNPSQLGEGLRLIKKEYTFKSSNDRVDILLMDSSGRPVPVEVKPYCIPSGSDSEILQALKYKHLAADDYDIPCKQVRCILAAPGIPDDIKRKCIQLGIEPFIPTSTNK